jgi:colanic acid/amylovoran biosynthesis glycosyltransferase
MRVAFFVFEFPTVSETFIVNQIIGIRKAGHSVDIFSKNRTENVPIHKMVVENGLLDSVYYLDQLPQLRSEKLKELFFACIKNLSNRRIFFLIKAIFRNYSSLSIYDFIPYLDKPGYDVVHAHFGINGKYVAQLKKLGLFKKSKFITTFHGYDLNQHFAKNNFYKDLFEECNHFTVNSNYSKRRLVSLGCDENKINVLPNGVNTTVFRLKTERIQTEVITLLFVGRFIKLKGPHLFLEICRLLQQHSKIKFKAILVGDGPMLDEIKLKISEYNLIEKVTLTGISKHEEVICYMENSDIFILPGIEDNGLAEAQGLVIQEAQSMQLPVLISNVGGMGEGIIDTVTGFIIPQNNLPEFVRRIEELSCDKEKRMRMGKAGRAFIENKYNDQVLNNQLLEMYQANNLNESVN